MAEAALVELDRNLWIASRSLPQALFIGDVGTRMTVIRLQGGDLFLHSPVALDDFTRAATPGVWQLARRARASALRHDTHAHAE